MLKSVEDCISVDICLTMEDIKQNAFNSIFNKINDIADVKNCIYKFTNLLDGKIYIGQTTQKLKDRLYNHFSCSINYKKSSYLYNSIRKYGWNNFIIDIIEQNIDSINLLNEREVFWIHFYKSNNSEFGYNLTDGGGNAKWNDDLKKKISDKRKGIMPKTPIHLNIKGKPNSRKGKKLPKETLDKMKKAHTGKFLTEEQKIKFKEKQRKHINTVWIDIKKKDIIRLILDNVSGVEICKILDISESTLTRKIKEFFNTSKLKEVKKMLKEGNGNYNE